MLIKYTIQITWFVTDSHTKVTSPRTGRNAFAVELEFLRSSSVLTASTLSLRHGRTTKPKRTAKPWRETWGSPCHLYQLRSTWQWAALEVEAQQAACFLQYCCMSNVTEYVSGSPGTTELRKTSNSTANAFVTVTYSYEMESKGFAQLFSYPCNGLNPAAGFWRFFFIDSRNWSRTVMILRWVINNK